MFRTLEYPSELDNLAKSFAEVRQQRGEFLKEIIQGRIGEGNLDNFDEVLEKSLAEYEISVQNAVKSGIEFPLDQVKSIVDLARWNDLQSIFFASTVITTIGYGNIVPVTFNGRLFCLFYALIGIPLCLTVIADLGGILADYCSGLPALFDKVGGVMSKSLISAFAALVFLFLFLSIGAVIFMYVEDEWTFFDSFYFCFITMTTIGFGDLVPQKPQYMLVCTLYILIGLGLTSTIIEVVRNEYAKSWERLQALAEALKKLSEAGGSDVAAFQNDLKKMVAVMDKRKSASKMWDKTFESILQSVNQPKPQPKIVQIIVYETSV